MFGLNFVEVLVIALVVLVLFGNRLPRVMADLAKGIHAFKEGMDEPVAPRPGTAPARPKAKKPRKPAVKAPKKG